MNVLKYVTHVPFCPMCSYVPLVSSCFTCPHPQPTLHVLCGLWTPVVYVPYSLYALRVSQCLVCFYAFRAFLPYLPYFPYVSYPT